MKCFARLDMAHITTIPDTQDPLQSSYHPNRSTDDSISTALHTALSHLDKRNTYVRMLFSSYSSAFNTKLITKLSTLDPELPGHLQVERVGSNTPSSWGHA
jgi:hypothetical protein